MTTPSTSWRQIPGTAGRYEASLDGQVRRAGRQDPVVPIRGKGASRTYITLQGHQYGYSTIVLVGLAWLGVPETGQHFFLKDPDRPHDAAVTNITRRAPRRGERRVQKSPAAFS